MFSFVKPFLFNLDPETAHSLAIKSLKYNLMPGSFFSVENEEMLKTNLFGRDISNPIGLAAGFDKSAEVYNELFKLGFGFVEVGTVTPEPQYGNKKPRIFRLEKDEALINRLGFNNDGSEIIKKRLENNIPKGFLGINIGPNKNTDDMISDFLKCAKSFFPLGDYVTINISSPNTEGLRDFHKPETLTELLSKINELRNQSNFNKSFLLKISPDLNDLDIGNIIELSLKYNIDGLILTNTSESSRENLLDDKKSEKGGLSGKPIRDLSTNFIKKFYSQLNGKIPIIGVGGVDSGKVAFEKIKAGANALQLYTGMIYKGPYLIRDIKKELISLLKKEGFQNIKEAVGSIKN